MRNGSLAWSRRRPGVARAMRPAFAAAVGVVAFVALDWAAIHTVPGRLVDGRSLRGALLTASRPASQFEHVLDLISVTALLCAVCGILVIALVRQRRDVGLAALAVLLGANVSTQVLKQVLLVRPDLGLVERTPATVNSLPSGHVTVALSVVVALVLVLPARARPPVAVVGLLLTAAVTMGVMSSGWHRASDAVAACLVVGVWAALVLLVLAVVDPPSPPPAAGRPARWGRVAAVLGGTGALAVLALLSVPSPGGVLVLLTAYEAGISLSTGAQPPCWPSSWARSTGQRLRTPDPRVGQAQSWGRLPPLPARCSTAVSKGPCSPFTSWRRTIDSVPLCSYRRPPVVREVEDPLAVGTCSPTASQGRMRPRATDRDPARWHPHSCAWGVVPVRRRPGGAPARCRDGGPTPARHHRATPLDRPAGRRG